MTARSACTGREHCKSGRTIAAVLVVQRQDAAAHQLAHCEELLQGRGPCLGRLARLPRFLAGAKFVGQGIGDLPMPWSRQVQQSCCLRAVPTIVSRLPEAEQKRLLIWDSCA